MQGPQGQLVFEDDQGRPDPQTAEVLSELLRDCNVPVVVLNACQSAMVDERAEDAFASVAAGLLRLRCAERGGHGLFAVRERGPAVPAGVLPPAVRERQRGRRDRAGRQQMLAHRDRVCAAAGIRSTTGWCPCLYEQDAFDCSFASRTGQARPTSRPCHTGCGSANCQRKRGTRRIRMGLSGGTGALLQLERALRAPPAGILIHGLGGVGKTTLCRGLLQWLAATGGLGQGCFWFTFQDIRSAEFVFNQMVGTLFGTNALASVGSPPQIP